VIDGRRLIGSSNAGTETPTSTQEALIARPTAPKEELK